MAKPMEMSLPTKHYCGEGGEIFYSNWADKTMCGDKLLVISDDEEALKETYRSMGISEFSYQKND